MKFALITEGVTDSLVLNELIHNYYNDDSVQVRPMQPLLDNTDKQENFGGWEQVLNYCKNEDLNEILVHNEFIVIQIDTDIVENRPFEISLRFELEEIYNRITDFFNTLIKENEVELNRIIFAIGVHSIECWLVGILDSNHKVTHVNNCINRLNFAINGNKKYNYINPKRKENSKKTYIDLSNSLKKQKEILKISKSNLGFQKFIEQLDKALILFKALKK